MSKKNLNEILQEINGLKEQEKALSVKRKILENHAIEMLGTFSGLSKSFQVDNYKVTVKKTETYKFIDDWKIARENIPAIYRPERIKYEVDKKLFDNLKEKEFAAYEEISKFVEIKDGSTSITIA